MLASLFVLHRHHVLGTIKYILLRIIRSRARQFRLLHHFNCIIPSFGSDDPGGLFSQHKVFSIVLWRPRGLVIFISTFSFWGSLCCSYLELRVVLQLKINSWSIGAWTRHKIKSAWMSSFNSNRLLRSIIAYYCLKIIGAGSWNFVFFIGTIPFLWTNNASGGILLYHIVLYRISDCVSAWAWSYLLSCISPFWSTYFRSYYVAPLIWSPVGPRSRDVTYL